jgi:nucleoside-diphosphate-sugar epimerase
MARNACDARCLILGCGYTGRRVAARMARRGFAVAGTSRSPRDLQLEQCTREHFEGALVVHSLPPVDTARPITPLLLPYLSSSRRVVYLSTTGVYGAQCVVNEQTLPHPASVRERTRLEEEQLVRETVSSSLILRPAAIYGPGRGVHVAMRDGRHRLWADGSNYISRIHVDDLAAHIESALLSTITGAFPAADDEPCPAIEIALFCAELTGSPMPAPTPALDPDDTRRTNRRVDGSVIRKLLGITLRYPSYRTGIPAALAEEAAQMNLYSPGRGNGGMSILAP